MKTTRLILSAFTLWTGLAFGNSYLVYDAPETLRTQLKERYRAVEVFSPREKEFLAGSGVSLDALKIELAPEEFESLQKAARQFPNVRIESNPMQKLFSQKQAPDPYERLQWALKNLGEDLVEWESDIDITVTEGVEGEDIGATGQIPGAQVLVAVVDSGVDINHPDLAGQIYLKEQECKNLEAYNLCLQEQSDAQICHDRFANADADGNGYPMDCHGWSMSENVPGALVEGGPKVVDSDGHGTHVAGVIAAKRNGKGIVGAALNAKIIPVQVGLFANASDGETATDKIAKGLLYAIRSGAQVVNLSLGWRFDQDSLLMRQMIELALSKDILVVAAAGNDAHHGPVYPCSYEGVICVAAHTVNGDLASFSNYGSHVDIAAPGAKILSSWPKGKRSRAFTQDDDYEYLSGTSQAAPYAAAVLANLLGMGFSPDEAAVKLLKGARPFQERNQNFVRTGKVDLKRAIETDPSSFLYPAHKSAALVEWKEGSEQRSFLLKLTNRGRTLSGATIKVAVANSQNSDELSLEQSQFILPSLAAGELWQQRVYFNAPYVGSGEWLFEVSISAPGQESRFFLQAQAVNIVDGSRPRSDKEEFPILGANALEDVSIIPFNDFSGAGASDLLAVKSVNNNVFFSLLAQKGRAYEQSDWRRIEAKDPVILSLSKVDIDQNGSFEYVVALINLEDKERKTEFHVFDENFAASDNEICPGNVYNNDLSVMPGSFQWAVRKGRMVPAWIGVGKRPESERPPADPWQGVQTELEINRLYFLTPNGPATAAFPGEEELPLQLLYQSPTSKVSGSLSIVAGDSFGYLKNYAIYSYRDGLRLLDQFALSPYVDLLNSRPLPMAGSSFDAAFFTQTSLDGMRLVAIENERGKAKISQGRVSPLRPGQRVERTLAFNGVYAIHQEAGLLVASDASTAAPVPNQEPLAATTNTARIHHHILKSKMGLYLRAAASPGMTSELIDLNAEGQAKRSAQWMMLAAQGCFEIGVIETTSSSSEGSSEELAFACPSLGKILKFAIAPSAQGR